MYIYAGAGAMVSALVITQVHARVYCTIVIILLPYLQPRVMK